MSIHVITGVPGSGKSLYATVMVIKELVYGSRNVVTNLPLNVGRLSEYLQEAYPKVDCRVAQRLRMLTDEEMASFWKFRGPDEVPSLDDGFTFEAFTFTPNPNASPEEETKRYDSESAAFARRYGLKHAAYASRGRAMGDSLGRAGVAYFLDEAHIAFNARDWATLGRGALHYLSQHRKMGDIVFAITQSAGNLDKQFRSVAEDFTVMRNEYTMTYGIFKGRGRFLRRTSRTEPTQGTQFFEETAFQLDIKGVASCYDTAKGIGVHGTAADKGRRAKGIPIMFMIPAVILLGCLFVVAPPLLGNIWFNKQAAKTKQSINQAKPDKPKTEAVSSPEAPPVTPEPEKPAVLAPVASPVRVKSYVARPDGRFILRLTDGRYITEKDGQLIGMQDGRAYLVDGSVIGR